MFTDAANRRYTLRTAAFMTGYAAVNGMAITGAFDDLQGPGRWALALAVAAPIAGQVWATWALVREGDEFARAIAAKRIILAWGACMILFSTWGLLESYAGAAHAPGWLIYPLFWLSFGVISPFVRTSRL